MESIDEILVLDKASKNKFVLYQKMDREEALDDSDETFGHAVGDSGDSSSEEELEFEILRKKAHIEEFFKSKLSRNQAGIFIDKIRGRQYVMLGNPKQYMFILVFAKAGNLPQKLLFTRVFLKIIFRKFLGFWNLYWMMQGLEILE